MKPFYIKPDCLKCPHFGTKECDVTYTDCHTLTGFTSPCLNCNKNALCKYRVKAMKKGHVIIECKHYDEI